MDGLVLGLGGRGCVGLGRRWFVALHPWQGARLLGSMAFLLGDSELDRGRKGILGDSGLGARLLGGRAILLGDSELDGSRVVHLGDSGLDAGLHGIKAFFLGESGLALGANVGEACGLRRDVALVLLRDVLRRSR
jgi:hypothetical protein